MLKGSFFNIIPTPQGGILKTRHEFEVLVNKLRFPVITKRGGFTGGRENKLLKYYANLNSFINGQDCFGEEVLV